jgi:hypothetical protein
VETERGRERVWFARPLRTIDELRVVSRYLSPHPGPVTRSRPLPRPSAGLHLLCIPSAGSQPTEVPRERENWVLSLLHIGVRWQSVDQDEEHPKGWTPNSRLVLLDGAEGFEGAGGGVGEGEGGLPGDGVGPAPLLSTCRS